MPRVTSETAATTPPKPRRRQGRAAPVSGRARISAGLPPRLSPRKPARQDRSRATVDAILEAAVDLLSSQGYARTSTNRIAARAGVSVGSLYQYFPNKDAIVAALFERHAEDIARVVEQALADMRQPAIAIRDVFRRMLLGFEALHDADPGIVHALDPRSEGRQQLAQVVHRREQRFRQEFADVLRGRPDVRRGDYALMASLLFDIVEAIVESLMHGDARRFDRRQALDEAVEATCRYIEIEPGSAR